MRLFRALLATVALSFNFAASAQIAHDLTVFSEDGDLFTLVVNGQAINPEPAASVTAKDLQVGFAKVQVKFADESIPGIVQKNLQIATPGTAPSGPVAVVYRIAEKKGERKLRFVSRNDKQVQNAPVIIINN